MQYLPLGALGEVTGSSHLIHIPETGQRILVDCGAVQGGPDDEARNAEPFPFDPKTLTCVLLTHAHYDHCGRLPDLYAQGFTGKVYATEETIALARIVLDDAAGHTKRFKRRDLKRIRWQGPGDRLFTKPVVLARDLFLFHLRSAHIMGATSLELRWGPPGAPDEQQSIIFSGDVGNNVRDAEVQPLQRERMGPARTADWAVLESTYGDRERPSHMHDPMKRRGQLARTVQEGLRRGGPVIIPVFAIQRAQEVLYDLHYVAANGALDLDGVDVVVDGGMLRNASKVVSDGLKRDLISPNGKVRPAWLGKHTFRELGLDPADPDHIRWLRSRLAAILECTAAGPRHDDDPVPFRDFRPLTTAVKRNRPELIAAAHERPMIVVTTSGMAEGGAVLAWLEAHVTRPETTVLFTGYCSRHTLGARLLAIGATPEDERVRHGGTIDVGRGKVAIRDLCARVEALWGYSGHADQRSLVDWIFPKNDHDTLIPVARRLILNHGEDHARDALAARVRARSEEILGRAMEVRLPRTGGDGVDLATGDRIAREVVLGRAERDETADLRELVSRAKTDPTLRAKLDALLAAAGLVAPLR